MILFDQLWQDITTFGILAIIAVYIYMKKKNMKIKEVIKEFNEFGE